MDTSRTVDAPLYPRVLLVDSGNSCNLKCAICDHRNMVRPVGRMSPQLFRRIIDETAEKSPSSRVWLIFFGEPCLVPDMGWRIRYAKTKGLHDVVLNTNGTLLTKELAREYIDAGLDTLYVGIDAVTEATYRKIRVRGDIHQVVDNVTTYADLLRREGRFDQKVFVQFVVTDENANEVGEFRALWTQKGVGVKIRPMVSWAGLVGRSGPVQTGPRFPCHWAMQTMSVLYDGTVVLCACDVHGRVPCDHLDDSSVEGVWRSDPLSSYRAMHQAGTWDTLPSMCRTCEDWRYASCETVAP